MSREIPQAVRAVAGLAATVLDEARRLPRTLPGLPVRVIGLAMQATMKLQQHYTGLVARGDEVFTGLRGADEPGLATFDEDEPAPAPVTANGNGVRTSAFDRAAADVPDEELAEEVASLIDDEVSGLPPEPAPEEVVEALQDITDEVQAADLHLGEPGLTTEDALETALLEADGAPDSALADGGTADAGLVDVEDLAEASVPSDPGGSPVGEAAGAPDVAPSEGPAIDVAPGEDVSADVATEVDVLTPDGGIATVEGTVTDEGVAAPETGDAAAAPAPDTTVTDATAPASDATVTDAQARVDEAAGSEAGADESRPGAETAAAAVGDGAEATGRGDEVVTAEGARVDDALGGGDDAPAPAAGGAPATDTAVATDEGGTPVAEATGDEAGSSDDGATGGLSIEGYDDFTLAQLRGRLRGYQLVTVQELLAYEQANRARPQFVTMLRNRLEKLEQQAVESSPLAPRGA
ncbi:hypothetical protein [Geodermatophilus sp. CPCC 206100]|uniref:hypothetical protein n=1 Tax=Geodermatophilus sp. CPCC 206100 TaxID=3020054 RepID=UPI003B00682C